MDGFLPGSSSEPLVVRWHLLRVIPGIPVAPGSDVMTPWRCPKPANGLSRTGAITAASATLLSLVLFTGCATVATRPFSYEVPPTVGGADREYCHALATTAAEKTYARYAAMMGIDPLGRSSRDTFGGSALAAHAWAERDAVYEREMRVCLRAKGYAE